MDGKLAYRLDSGRVVKEYVQIGQMCVQKICDLESWINKIFVV